MYFFYFASDIAENPQNYDIDYFFYDDEKLIHFASGGLYPFGILTQIIPENYLTLKSILRLRRRFNIKENGDIQRDNLNTLEEYKSFFNLMASRGFYSYDKVNIDNPECYNFQLIANPIYNATIEINNNKIYHQEDESQAIKTWIYDLSLNKLNNKFPIDNSIFDIREYLE
jgi:hypothetical protein